MVEPTRNQKHGNGDRNDNDVANQDRPGQKDRDEKIKQGEKEIKEDTKQRTGSE